METIHPDISLDVIVTPLLTQGYPLSVQIAELRPHLAKVALHLTCWDDVLADDLVQHTLTRLLTSKNLPDHPDRLRAYAATALKNAFIDHCRAEKHAHDSGVAINDIPDVVPLPLSETPEQRWLQVTSDDLRHAIEELKEPYRTPFSMSALENKKHREIARLLGRPLSTISNQIARAKQKLAVILTRSLDESCS